MVLKIFVANNITRYFCDCFSKQFVNQLAGLLVKEAFGGYCFTKLTLKVRYFLLELVLVLLFQGKIGIREHDDVKRSDE